MEGKEKILKDKNYLQFYWAMSWESRLLGLLGISDLPSKSDAHPQPRFLLLLKQKGQQLRVPIFQDLKTKPKKRPPWAKRTPRNRRPTPLGRPPQRIIETYGPVTWVHNDSWRYRTHIETVSSQ
jgi:hypothetical protein